MSTQKIPYVINLFGSAIQVWELNLPEQLAAEMTAFMEARKIGWHELIFDLELINKFKVKHWSALAQKRGALELLLTNDARIELRKNGRLAERIQVSELLETTQLFAKYNVSVTHEQVIAAHSLLIIEELKGQVAKFTFEAAAFQMEQLTFFLRQDTFVALPRLATIAFMNSHLTSKKDDLLLLGQRVVLD